MRAFEDHAGADVAHLRTRVASFIDNLSPSSMLGAKSRARWVGSWVSLGNRYSALAGRAFRSEDADKARENWLCAFTAFEVARWLTDPRSQARLRLSHRSNACFQQFELCLTRPLERIQINSFDDERLTGYFLPAVSSRAVAPALICIADADISVDGILRRLSPVTIGRGISLLVVDGSDTLRCPPREASVWLSCWLDHLAGRSDIDSGRIAVYGEGMAAWQASSFAASDDRLAAAVCDGGLLESLRQRSALRWMAGTRAAMQKSKAISALRFARRIRCPFLVVAGGSGLHRGLDAIHLHSDCVSAGVDMTLALPRTIRTSTGDLENFVTTDNFVFDWLEKKLDACGYSERT
ncbi:alpha/beta hydrolase family protein [Bradyrhizobium macuxiense]|nr:hypothetical protein [Bradyrhizobium macuxiense]